MVRMYTFLVLLTIFFLSAITPAALAQPTLYLVRHAETLRNWPWPREDSLYAFKPLSAEGVVRAQKLAEQFKPGSLVAIYSSRTTRTLHTALPVAEKLGLSIEVTDACADTTAIDSLYAQLTKRFGPHQAILLICHSNIIPYLLLKAGLPDSCREAMGIKSSTEHTWLFTEGYDSLWRIDRVRATRKECTGFERFQF